MRRRIQGLLFVVLFLLVFAFCQWCKRPLYVSLPFSLLTAIGGFWLMEQNCHRHIGGNRLLKRSQALAASRKRLKSDYPSESGFGFWDTIRMPDEYKSKGIFVMGEQGSGKTADSC